MRVLVIEDNPDIAANLGDYLEDCGHTVDFAADGVTGLHLAVVHDFDAIVLDLNLPGMDGLEVCRKLRGDARKQTPVLMLTARDSLENKLAGFDSGADDYLIKPFAYPELLARIRALQRRAGKGDFSGTEFSHNGIVLDTVRHTVTRDGKPVNLSPKEYGVLLEIMKADGSYVNAEELFDTVWAGASATDLTDAIKTTVYSLRRKLGEGNGITSTRGKGYRLS